MTIKKINEKKLLKSEIDNYKKENSLSLKTLSLLPSNNPDSLSKRPTSCLHEIVEWVNKEFSTNIFSKNINSFLHTTIVVDGDFLLFCEEKKVKINVLYKDPIVSWKDSEDFEKFNINGIFLVKNSNFEFILSSLFYQGANNEAQNCVFVTMDNSNYEKYISFRNEFLDWVSLKDRNNLNVRVVGGDDISYTNDNSWDDLFLPENLKQEIKKIVDGFLSSKDFYLKNKMPWKRGILLYGEPGNGKTSLIRTLMSEYNFKPVTISNHTDDSCIKEAFLYAETQSPALLYFEDLDSLFDSGIDISAFLNLLDGIAAKNGMLVIGTTNNINNLRSNITDRPSRFDRKFEIPLPDQDMALKYIKKCFGNLITLKQAQDISKNSKKYNFSYAYLKELYISSMFEALSNNRKLPSKRDIDYALNRLIKEKNILNSGNINTDNYFK